MLSPVNLPAIVSETLVLVEGEILKPFEYALVRSNVLFGGLSKNELLEVASVDLIMLLESESEALTSCFSRAKWHFWTKSHRSAKVIFLT